MQLNGLLKDALEYIFEFLGLSEQLNFLKTNREINFLKISPNVQHVMRRRLIADDSPLPELSKVYLATSRISYLIQQGQLFLAVRKAVISINKIVTNRISHYLGVAREDAIRLGYSPQEVRPDWFSLEHLKALREGISYQEIFMLNFLQVEGITLGLTREQVTSINFSPTHLQKLKTWKQPNDPNNINIQELRNYYDSIKHFNETQLKGLKAGFLEKDVQSIWFSYKHIELVLQKGYFVDELRGLNEKQIQVVELGVDFSLVREFKNISYNHIKVLQDLLKCTNNNFLQIDLSSSEDLRSLFSLSMIQIECSRFITGLTVQELLSCPNLGSCHAYLVQHGIPFKLIKDLPEQCLLGILYDYEGVNRITNDFVKELIKILVTTNKINSSNYSYNKYFCLAYSQGIPMDILKQLSSYYQLKGMVKYNLSFDQVMHPNIKNILRAIKAGYRYEEVCDKNLSMLHSYALKEGVELKDIVNLSLTDLIENFPLPKLKL